MIRKMKYLAMTILLVGLHAEVAAQSTWQENRQPFPVKTDDAKDGLKHLFYSVDYEYKYDEEGTFICDVTYHVISRATNDDGLEASNRIYISLNNVIEIMDIKSRTFSKDGVVVTLDEQNIKEIGNEEDKDGYKIFAVEGAEIGGEIEYSYTKRVHGSTFVNENIQFSIPVEHLQFTLTCPENLEFDFKVINDPNVVEQIDTAKAFNRYQVVIRDIPAFVAEPFSGVDATKKRIDFRLAYNSVAGKKRLNTYAMAGKRVYEMAHELSKGEQKMVDDFIKKTGGKSKDPIKRFKTLEHELKKMFYMDKDAPSDDIEYLFSHGFARRVAFLKLYVAIAERLAIDYEIVVTPDRFSSKLEPDFDSWNYLDDYLLYLPKEKAFVAIQDYSTRYGTVSPENSATQALFVHAERIQDFDYPVTRMGYVPAAGYKENMNNLDITVSFDNRALNKITVDATRTFTGNEANYYKSMLFWMNQERLKEQNKELAEYLAGEGKVLKFEIVNANNSAEDWHKPFVAKCVYENENMVELAGNSLLFKVGDLIGLQSELYQEKERLYDVENSNNRGYIRNITVKLPAGYKVANPEDITMNEVVRLGDRPVFGFESSYVQEGDVLTIKILEYYDEIYFPKERFEEFRKVINAAADWNKITLLLKMN